MKKTLLLFAALYFSLSFAGGWGEAAFAQNLVPNPSFEDTVHCPTNQGQVVNAKGWWSTRASSDYFNECAPNGNLANVPNTVGSTMGNYQYASNGYAFMGMYTYALYSYRECIGTKLDSALVVGKKYYCQMKINSAFASILSAGVYSNNFGMKFTMDSFSQTNPISINNFAQFHDTTVIKDTLDWVLIKGSFIADSAYQFLSIGNFYNNLHTDTVQIVTGGGNGYYFVDEVSVCSDSSCLRSVGGITSITNDNSVGVYPNPTNTEINIKTNGTIEQIEIFNALGQQVKSIFHPPIQSITTIDVSHFINGIYLLKIKTTENTFSKKINIIH